MASLAAKRILHDQDAISTTALAQTMLLTCLQVEEVFLRIWERFAANGAEVDEDEADDLPELPAIEALQHLQAGKRLTCMQLTISLRK